MWARFALRRLNFPDPSTLNLFAAPRWDFIFGITLLLDGGRVLACETVAVTQDYSFFEKR